MRPQALPRSQWSTPWSCVSFSTRALRRLCLPCRLLRQGLGSAALVARPLRAAAQAPQQVLVVGGGFAGATAAKYLKRFNPALDVSLVEPQAQFVSCPLSNRVISGGMSLAQISYGYQSDVNRHGLNWVRASADAVQASLRQRPCWMEARAQAFLARTGALLEGRSARA
jgi:hypothetical protein